METKKLLEDFINSLPIQDSDKQELFVLLEQDGGEQMVQLVLQAMLENASLNISYKEALLKAEQDFKADLSEIERNAKQLIKSAREEEDKQALEEARKKIA